MEKKCADKPAEAQTTPERMSEEAIDTLAAYGVEMEKLCDGLARASEAGRVDAQLKETVEQSIASLRRTSMNLLRVQTWVTAMGDELSARLQDVEKSLDRKWYRANPPSNTYIDMEEGKKDHFARGINLYKIFLILFIGSFVGVAVELLWCLAKHGYLESRSGLVYGPFNMLYGVGAAALSLALYRFRNHGRWLSFLGGFVVGSVVEYACSWLQETLLGSVSWDYSAQPFNLNGRICLLYSVFWGILGVLWIKDIYPRMSKWILKLPNRGGKVLAWALALFLAWDCAVSGLAVWRWSQRVQGVEPRTAVARLLDERFPDERMERIYANMRFQ